MEKMRLRKQISVETSRSVKRKMMSEEKIERKKGVANRNDEADHACTLWRTCAREQDDSVCVYNCTIMQI